MGNVSNFNKVKCTKTLQEGNMVCGFSNYLVTFRSNLEKGVLELSNIAVISHLRLFKFKIIKSSVPQPHPGG